MLTFHEACAFVFHNCRDDYARSYAAFGLTLRDVSAGDNVPDIVRVQSLYILNNVQFWRGDLAREVKLALRFYGKM